MTLALLEKRFSKSLNTYNIHAIVQKEMAHTLLSLLPDKKYLSVLEIGCGTGFLTVEFIKNFKFDRYAANDIVAKCSGYINKISSDIEFIQGDISRLKLDYKYDLIISNAVFQWFQNPKEIIKKLKSALNFGGILAFSCFGCKNFYELESITNIGLEYYSFDNIVKEEVKILEFSSLFELLKHIKYTGVNSIQPYNLTKSKIYNLERSYIEKYGRVKLTYNPVYVIEDTKNLK